MQRMMVGVMLGALMWTTPGTAEPVYDVVIYGGTSAAVIAAAQTHEMGKTAVIVSPDTILGGMTSSGLGWTDSGNTAVIGGMARNFYHRIWQYYQQDEAWRWQDRESYGNRGQGTPAMDGDSRTMWTFEPHVAEAVFESIVDEYDIPVYRDEWLDRESGVTKRNGRIEAIMTLAGNTYQGRIFIDATYEGDLMAAAGVSYHVGREANSVYNETLNGIQKARAISHQFNYVVDPYIEPGDPESRLLPRIHDGDPGEDGEGDQRVQAYNFRMCLTKEPENRVPFPKPENYDPMQYELLGRYIEAGWRGMFNKFDPIPNAKTDTNNHGAFSTDNIGMNYDYPEASYEEREAIIREHREYQQGYFWYLANDPRVPEDIRNEMSQWGLARDEFVDSDHWPHQIYVREARRMLGDFVVTERHLRRLEPTPRPVGMGSYNMDSHNTQRYVAYDEEGRGHARNEGDIQINPGGPYPIDFGALVPRREECANLLVPVCVSSSHIAFGSIRMEPVFMILGQSAATAAAMAIDNDLAVQDVDYAALRERLLDDGQILEWKSDRRKDATDLTGIIMDHTEAEVLGDWIPSSVVGRFVGFHYLHDRNSDKGEASVRYTVAVPAPGRYEVRISYTAEPNRASNVPVTVYHAEGSTMAQVDQQRPPETEEPFYSLGVFAFDDTAVVIISNADTDGYVIADAVQILPE